jgi:hypothetical protein
MTTAGFLAAPKIFRTRISYARGCTGATIDASMVAPSLAVISRTTRSASFGRKRSRQPATTDDGASPADARTGVTVAAGNARERKATYCAK